jgi:putative membrane protein
MDWKTVSVVVLIVLFIIVTVQNTEVVSFSFLFWKITMSRIVMLLITFVIGIVAGYVLCTIRNRSLPSSGKEL